MSAVVWRGLLPAKINLSLHVNGKRDDGYHDLESLVAFASIGDRLTIERLCDPDEPEGLMITGPFAAHVPEENSITQAHKRLQDRLGYRLPVRMGLEKNLPVASGIGGGSADAAGCLRGLKALFDIDDEDIVKLAPELGADVPVCLLSQASWMTGVGHSVTAISGLPDCGIILVNPGFAVSTQSIFETLNAPRTRAVKSGIPHVASWESLLAFMTEVGNDLAAVACRLHPEIQALMERLRGAGADYVSMSGSGATCFALVPENAIEATLQRLDLPASYWCQSGRLIASPDTEIDEIKQH